MCVTFGHHIVPLYCACSVADHRLSHRLYGFVGNHEKVSLMFVIVPVRVVHSHQVTGELVLNVGAVLSNLYTPVQ